MLSDPEQRRRFIAARLIALLFLPTTNQQARAERRGQAIIPFRARRQHFLQAVVGEAPLQGRVDITDLEGQQRRPRSGLLRDRTGQLWRRSLLDPRDQGAQ